MNFYVWRYSEFSYHGPWESRQKKGKGNIRATLVFIYFFAVRSEANV